MRELFPGQSEKASFTLDQVKCLASAARAEVFWSFSPSDPRSVAEVAEALGRSASATTYHVSELVDAGLLLVVDERKRRSRTERLFVMASQSYISHSFKEGPEYRENMLLGYAAMLRLLLREREELSQALLIRPDLIECATYRRLQARVPVERAAELKTEVLRVLREFTDSEGDKDDMLFSLTFTLSPALVESRKINGKLKRKGRGKATD